MKIIQIKAMMGGSGKTVRSAIYSTAIAEFIERGQATQRAVDAIIEAEQVKKKS